MKSSIAIIIILLLTSLPLTLAQELSYDANGNLITGDGKFRVYNDANQLVEVRNGSDASAPLLETYNHHPIEERIHYKVVYNNGVWKETVYYVHENYVAVENASGLYNYTYVKQNGVLVAQKDDSKTEFIHNDHLGSASLVTDEQGGHVENTSYKPFGGIASGGEETRFDYEGKEYSSITGDYDFHFRKYDPELKIFTQPDTIIPELYKPQDLNAYSFESNNPSAHVDPSGHFGIFFTSGMVEGLRREAESKRCLCTPYFGPSDEGNENIVDGFVNDNVKAPIEDVASAFREPSVENTIGAGLALVTTGKGGGVKNAGKAVDRIKSSNVPDKVLHVARSIKRNNGRPLQGYKGGRDFLNDGRGGGEVLPTDTRYKEYDVNPFKPGENRGKERLVIGEDGSVYYTDDHYESFKKVDLPKG